eukprot:269767-Chlamydomonas_euryale.AAC.1
MLVGVGGSGKSSLTRFAAHMGGFETFRVELTRGYGPNEFREDLKKLYYTAGVEGKPVVFLFSDTQVWAHVRMGFGEGGWVGVGACVCFCFQTRRCGRMYAWVSERAFGWVWV